MSEQIDDLVAMENEEPTNLPQNCQKRFIFGVVEGLLVYIFLLILAIWQNIFSGFYGRPWSSEQRKLLFKRMEQLDMNTYVYAPKDDAKHRAEWRQLYTGEESGLFETGRLLVWSRVSRQIALGLVRARHDRQYFSLKVLKFRALTRTDKRRGRKRRPIRVRPISRSGHWLFLRQRRREGEIEARTG